MMLKAKKKKKDPSHPLRSLAKAVSWETISLVLTMLIAYPFTHSICSSVELALACLAIKIIFYYHHERVWHQIDWGKINGENNNET
jgi:uncharacterized membrane protein